MDTVTAAEAELAQISSLVRHDFQTSLQLQDLINQGEAALIALYKYTSCHGSTKLANASIQAEESVAYAPGGVNPCTQLVSDFCTAAACGLQLVYAGALAPDATTLLLCAETQRNVLRLLDLLHVTDVLKHSLCMEAPKPDPLETATEGIVKPRASSSALQITAAAIPAKKGIQSATATLSESCANSTAHSLVATLSNVNGKANASSPSGVLTSPAAAGPAAQQSTASGPGKGSSYPLGSLEVWGAQWGALRLACRKLAAVPHQHRVSACLAICAQEALWASNKGVGFLLPEERLALLHALPAALFLLFSSEDNEAQALEALGGPKTLMKCLQLLRARPVVAAFGERPISLLALLQASPYLSSLGAELGKEWITCSPQDLQGGHLAAVESSYKMSGAVNDVRHTHAALSANMTSLVIRMEEYGARRATIPLEVVTEAMTLTESSLKSLSSWAQLLLDSQSWCTFCAVASHTVQRESRQHYNPEDLTAMLEIMACLQGLAGQLLSEQAWLTPLLQQSVRAQAQHVANNLSAAIEKPSLPRKVLDAADAVRTAIIGWSGAALRQRPQPPAHRSSRLRGLAASVMRASGQRSSLHELAAGASSIGPPETGEGVQYGMGTAGPTDLQRHTLVCALEVLLKEAQPSGMGGLIRRGPLGDSLTKELSAFHASVLRWPHLLDFPASVKQASSMASLGLRQCRTSAPSRPGPCIGVPPLPMQLIRHAMGPLHACCSADLCLAPLAVYNDTAALCRERLGSEQMAHAAEQAALAAVELLLDLLSHAVFSHAKQTAEASLRGLDNADRSAGEATLPDHFQALLRRPGVQLPNGAISLRAGLVPRLQRLLASDGADLAERLADSDSPCAALPELEYQVQVLERAHRNMAASLALPPWSSIWSQPRLSQQAASSADCQISHPRRITEHATDAILKLVTSETCTYGSRSRRFVFEGTREAVEHLPMQQDSRAASGSSTPRHAVLNGDQTAAKGAHATGSSKAGSKGHTAVGCICGDSLGDAELAAFMRLCGPHGVEHLAAALAREAGACMTECFVAIAGAAGAPGALPGDVMLAAANGPAELYAMLTDALTPAAGSEDAHRAVRALHSVGGALLALMRLEACISTHSVAQFMAAAPLLGITPDERGALTQPGAGEVTPIAGALFEVCAEQRLAHVSASSDAAVALQMANALLQQAEEGCWWALEPPHLLPTFLEGLKTELSSVRTALPTPENPSPIPLALSSLLFALAVLDLGIAVPVQTPSPGQPAFATSPILPTVSRSAGRSSELIAAVHCEAELGGTPQEQHKSFGAPDSAYQSEVGTARTSQVRWEQETQATGTVAAGTNDLLGGGSIRPDQDEGVGVPNSADFSPQRLRISGGDELDLPAGMSAESPTRPQAAERMDEAIQQGLQLYTPPKAPSSSDAIEQSAAANSLQVVSSVGRSVEPASADREAVQASSTVPSSQGAAPGASADELPTEQHSARSASSEGAALHQQSTVGVLHDCSFPAADSPVPELPTKEAAPGSCPFLKQEQSLPVGATGAEFQASAAGTSYPPEEQQETGGEDAPPSSVSEVDQVLDSIELGGAEDVGEEGQVTRSQKVAGGIGGSNGLAAQQTEQSSGRRKWTFKLGKAARAPDAPTALEASPRFAVAAAAAAADKGTPRKGGFRKQLARFSRSRGATPSASISDEALSSAQVADAAVQASAASKGKAAAVEGQGAVLLNAAEEGLQQSSGYIDVRRSHSEAAAANQPAKKGFLKKQLTRFGRARGVSEGASSAGEGVSGSSGPAHQSGTGKSQSAWMPVLGKSRSPRWPAQEPDSSDGDKEEQARLWWPEVGDAPLWGAALLVWLLELQPDFQLQDICRRLLVEADLAGHSESAMSESAIHGLANLRESQGVMEEALSSISSQCL